MVVKSTVMVVDDDDLTRNILEAILECHGYEVESADNGRHALEVFGKVEDISIIVSDLNMPEMDGLELIKQLRGEFNSEVPIIVLSGNDEIAVAMSAINEGACDYLIKDENIEHTVPLAVGNALEKLRIIEQNRALMAEITRKNEELGNIVSTMTKIGLALTSEPDWRQLLDVIVLFGRDLTGAEAGLLCLVEDGLLRAKIMHSNVSSGDEALVELAKLPPVDGACAVAVAAKKTAVLNVADIENYQGNELSEQTEFDSALGYCSKFLLAVPLRNPAGDVVGVLQLMNPAAVDGVEKFSFTAFHERLIESLASQAVLVIENARLVEANLRSARLSALGQGIAGAAHCVKNILNAFDGGAYILDIGLKRNSIDKMAQGWDILKRNTGVLRQLVLDMLDYSKEREPAYETVDVNEVCKGVVDFEAPIAAEKGVKVLFKADETLGLVDIDPQNVYRCVLNLVGNAVDAIEGDDGQITVACSGLVGGKRFTITVADNGSGIAEEHRKHLFDAFFTTKKARKGTGLGLSVTQKIIHEHSGTITVESVIGEGSTFTIDFPVKKNR